MKTVEEILAKLTDDQKQLLKDTIINGYWGGDDIEFLDEKGNREISGMQGYCTNDAKKGGHFSGRKISAMFRSIYKKLCDGHEIGRYISHCSDWWGDGSGDMLFIRAEYAEEFEKWARL